MEPSESTSSNQKNRQDEKVQPPSCALLKPPRVSGSRFLSCLMIAAAFIIIDLAILLYFFMLPTTPEDPAQVSPAPAVIEKSVNESAGPDDLQQKK